MLSNAGQYLPFLGILISAWLTYLATTYKFRKDKPKDPQQELFSYYEQMLKNMWEQSKAKDALIDKLEGSLDKIQEELWETKKLLTETKAQLAEATRTNESVQKHITETRVAMSQET